jgi:hypothetical protein
MKGNDGALIAGMPVCNRDSQTPLLSNRGCGEKRQTAKVGVRKMTTPPARFIEHVGCNEPQEGKSYCVSEVQESCR